ncbi:hypothetical protein ACP4OV_010544 [Aristida adscensionis]
MGACVLCAASLPPGRSVGVRCCQPLARVAAVSSGAGVLNAASLPAGQGASVLSAASLPPGCSLGVRRRQPLTCVAAISSGVGVLSAASLPAGRGAGVLSAASLPPSRGLGVRRRQPLALVAAVSCGAGVLSVTSLPAGRGAGVLSAASLPPIRSVGVLSAASLPPSRSAGGLLVAGHSPCLCPLVRQSLTGTLVHDGYGAGVTCMRLIREIHFHRLTFSHSDLVRYLAVRLDEKSSQKNRKAVNPSEASNGNFVSGRQSFHRHKDDTMHKDQDFTGSGGLTI